MTIPFDILIHHNGQPRSLREVVEENLIVDPEPVTWEDIKPQETTSA